MSALVICASSHHGNTRKVADRIGGVLGAPVLAPAEATAEQIDAADVVGFGSGVYWMAFDAELSGLVRSLTAKPRGTAFVFATSGLPETPLRGYTRTFSGLLTGAGFRVNQEVFHCRGLDTMGPFGLLGGMNKRRPSAADLAEAEAFAERIRSLPPR